MLLRIRDPADRDAWSTFQEVYLPIIRAYCGRCGLQEADIDDVAQEVLSVVNHSISSFEYQPQKGRFRSWLGTITTNEIKTYIAKRKNGLYVSGSSVLNALACTELDSDWVAIFSEHIFRVACDRIRGLFEARTWDCFQAIWFERLSAAAVANELGIPVHSVYVNKSRVLKRLKEEVRILAEDYPID